MLVRNSIQEQQCGILLRAISEYLSWRSNQRTSDNRGYRSTILTWLRHYTDFGKIRAENLKYDLSSYPVYRAPIESLQIHFKSDSRLNNHSLDTYILESIFKNKHLFLVTSAFTAPDKIKSRTALRDFILGQQSITLPEHAYAVANLLTADSSVENHLIKARSYYKIALQHDHVVAQQDLEARANAGDSEAQYILGTEYYHYKFRVNEAIMWCSLAAEKNHPDAIAYLFKSKFCADQHLMIARKYEKGDDVSKNLSYALTFYEKACSLKSRDAALRLGKLYQPDMDSVDFRSGEVTFEEVRKDAQKAFDYYQVAANQKDKTAFDAMAKIAEHTDDDRLRFRLAKTAHEVFSNHVIALTYFKKLADKSMSEAIDEINTLTRNNAEYAYLIAGLYKNDIKTINFLKKACFYYAIAVRLDHEASRQALEGLAVSGSQEAQYILGVEYYHRKGEFRIAITWCMRAAESKNSQAIKYLYETSFSSDLLLMIANNFEQGNNINQDMVAALTFYEKSCALNNKEAAIRLGKWYQQIDARKSFAYYRIAVKHKDQAAFDAMLKIAEHINDDDLRVIVAQVAIDIFANHKLALTYYKKLADRNVPDAVKQIGSLTTGNPENAYVVAKLYEEDIATSSQQQKACNYYMLAVQFDHEASRKALERLSIAGNSEAQYILGVQYYHRKSKTNEAIIWCMQASERRHANATAYLLNTSFSVDQYLMIAKKYEQGDGVTKNINSAITFYEKACALNNKEAAFRLGQLYQPSMDSGDPVLNELKCNELTKYALKSFDYYQIAAKQKDMTAFSTMDKIAEHINDDNLRFKLAQISLDVFANHVAALTKFKILADINLQDAVKQLSRLTCSNPEHAYIIADLYKDDIGTVNHLQKSCNYYAIGLQRDSDALRKERISKRLDTILNSKEITGAELTALGEMYNKATHGITTDYLKARECFEKACIKGCVVAYCHLGFMYQHAHGVKSDLIMAVRFYQLAKDRGYTMASKKIDEVISYSKITSKDLIAIAAMYYNGSDGILQDHSRALSFYKKASNLGDKSAALCLGELCQIEHEGAKKDVTLAFRSYLQAAKLGSKDALVPLERLGEEVSAENQLALSQVYASFFHNHKKATYWQIKAKEVEQYKF